MAARLRGLPRLEEQAVPLASPPCVVLAGLREVLMDGHDVLPGGGCDSQLATAAPAELGSTIASGPDVHHT